MTLVFLYITIIFFKLLTYNGLAENHKPTIELNCNDGHERICTGIIDCRWTGFLKDVVFDCPLDNDKFQCSVETDEVMKYDEEPQTVPVAPICKDNRSCGFPTTFVGESVRCIIRMKVQSPITSRGPEKMEDGKGLAENHKPTIELNCNDGHERICTGIIDCRWTGFLKDVVFDCPLDNDKFQCSVETDEVMKYDEEPQTVPVAPICKDNRSCGFPTTFVGESVRCTIRMKTQLPTTSREPDNMKNETEPKHNITWWIWLIISLGISLGIGVGIGVGMNQCQEKKDEFETRDEVHIEVDGMV